MLLDGIFLPLTTPFHPDGQINLHKLGANVAHYSRTPAAGMLVLSSLGETDALSDQEREAVLEAAIAAAADEKVMLAGVGGASVREALRMIGVAEAAGYDAVVVRTPEFAGEATMKAEVLTYFRMIADSAGVPVVIGTDAPRPMGVELIAELARHANVLGVLGPVDVTAIRGMTAEVTREVTVTQIFAAATRRMLRRSGGADGLISAASLTGVGPKDARAAVKTRKKKIGFQVLTSDTARMLDAFAAGAAGASPRLGACAPQACCEVWQAFKDGDPALAAEKQDRLVAAAERMEGWRGVAAVKHGCDWNGYFGGVARLPVLGLTGEERLAVEGVLVGLHS